MVQKMMANNVRFDDQSLVNVFRNAPVSILGWHTSVNEDERENDDAFCQGTDVVFNDAFCRLTGYSPWEIESKFHGVISEMMEEQEQQQFRKVIRELSQYPHEDTILSRFVRASGEKIGVQIRLNSVRQSDGSVWIYAMIMDNWRERMKTMERQSDRQENRKRVVIHTFGYFNVLIDNKPIPFQHEKAKELLALLVDRQGKYVSPSEIISCLWEDEPVNDNTRGRCRKAVFYLRETLEEYGLADLIESTSRGYRRLRTELVDCDLYRYLSGDRSYVHMFRGAYMTDYFWAEQTLTSLMYK